MAAGMTETLEALLLDRKQAIWTHDGFHVWGSPREGWHVCERATGQEVAHLTDPGMDSLGALDRYRTRLIEAAREKAG
jgi:hypothetical protein